MKIELEETGFNPIELKLTIESEEELLELYARLNTPVNNVLNDRHEKYNTVPLGDNLMSMWVIVNDLIKKIR